ncbi:MAG: efflux RND transporter periplasmic adaptor subunit [Bacteroidales bacterium]|nr:efflux RND transporter periplasmic adaptor subunit [Bacteroidales bacterium]
MKGRCVILLLLAAFTACGPRVKPAHTEPVTVKVLEIHPETQLNEASYVGTVEAVGSTTLLAPYSGTLAQLNIREGQTVKKGQVLARVYSEQVKSAFDIAKASLSQAQDGFDRLQKLKDGGAVADIKMVEVETQLEQAQAAMRAAQKAVEDGMVKAPFSGVISQVEVVKGVEVVALQPLARLLDNGGVNIRFPVPENEIPGLKNGLKLQVEVPALDKTFSAQLTSKGVVASALSHSYDCLAYLNARELMPGMVCKVRAQLSGESRILAPASALRVGENGRYAWCVEKGGKVVRRDIKVGGYSGRNVIVEEGLQEGDLLIIEGARKVSTGMKVKVVR